ncbi:hypothetical protein HPO96_22105 [Kribbella sandramycini]|uniref:Fibronectin type-III domain-containing protein n=1 Tax=Kribbella sandramycini TaxID=60450 RepID=A0A7Y4L263_9ACTN|nr:hypothetical protein [Kribbella sandramycini]MBB6566396.1 hypothetical protein [Kribbella sandramycini]NOL42944.1 hypothetical protein [Kribbella sandramycini]
MRKTLALTTALLTTTLTTPAWAAAPDAPTDVAVAWVKGFAQVTWQDNGEANVIEKEYVDTGVIFEVRTVAAGAANKAFVDGLPNSDRIRIRVTSRNAEGERSAVATSVVFDARRPNQPRVQDADLLADGSVRLSWTQEPVVDQTPGDPLDLPDEWLKITAYGPDGGAGVDIAVPLGATTFTVPPRPRPTSYRVWAGNTWGHDFNFGRRVEVISAQAGISGVAAQVPYGDSVQIYASPTSSPRTMHYASAVHLQARPTSSAAWKTYGKFSGYSNDDPIQTWIGSLGGRQYRIWLPGLKKINANSIELTPPASSSARSSRTISNLIITRFESSRPKLGQITKLNVRVLPAIAMNAALHQWDGKRWRYIRAVPLKNGAAIVPIKATRRGVTTWRIATPPLKINGLPVLATTSKPFTLTIR